MVQLAFLTSYVLQVLLSFPFFHRQVGSLAELPEGITVKEGNR